MKRLSILAAGLLAACGAVLALGGLWRVDTVNIVDDAVTPAKLGPRTGEAGHLAFLPHCRAYYVSDQDEFDEITTDADCAQSLDYNDYETGGASTVITVAASKLDADTTFNAAFNLAAVDCRGELHVRLKIDRPWNIKYITVYLYDGPSSNGYYASVTTFSGTDQRDSQGINSYAGRWFSLRIPRWRFATAVGTPAAWDTDNPEFTFKKMIFRVGTFANGENGGRADGNGVAIKIDRITCPVWPVACLVVQGDAFYDSFQTYIADEFAARGWPLRASIRTNSVGGGTPAPTWAQIAAYYAAHPDWEFGVHFESSNGDAFSASDDLAEARKSIAEQLHDLYTNEILRGSEFGTFLTGAGLVKEKCMSAALRSCGIIGGRAYCGVLGGFDPADGDIYGLNDLIVKQYTFLPLHGPYNWPCFQLGTTSMTDYTAANEFRAVLNSIVAYRASFVGFIHQVLASPGAGGGQNISTAYATAFLADLQTRVAAGTLVLCTMSDLWQMTYGRPGPVYVHPYKNCWVARTPCPARGYVAFGAQAADADTITINGRVYEFDPGNDGIGGDVEINTVGNSTVDEDLADAAAAINADDLATVRAEADLTNNILRLYAKCEGAAGNAITLAESTAGVRLTASGSTLAYGDAETVLPW